MSHPTTIAEAEDCIQRGLERLRDLPLNDTVSEALSFVAPRGYRLVVQLEEDGRKKRSTASISNWNHDSGEIVMFFEPLPVSLDAQEQRAKETTPPSSFEARIRAIQESRGAAEKAGGENNRGGAINLESEVRDCCIAMSEAEKLGKQFYGLKWFRDEFLPERGYSWTAALQDRQRVLNRAIQDGLIDTQAIPNPRNPAFPTTTLLLNREKAKGIVGSRFRPIVARGEPLSETIIRDRGAR